MFIWECALLECHTALLFLTQTGNRSVNESSQNKIKGSFELLKSSLHFFTHTQDMCLRKILGSDWPSYP